MFRISCSTGERGFLNPARHGPAEGLGRSLKILAGVARGDAAPRLAGVSARQLKLMIIFGIYFLEFDSFSFAASFSRSNFKHFGQAVTCFNCPE
jgi:hypothetical protein